MAAWECLARLCGELRAEEDAPILLPAFWDGVISGINVESAISASQVIARVTGTKSLFAELQSLAASVDDDISLELVQSPFGWLFKWHIA